MVNFILYDIIFFVAFTLAVVIFLYTHKKNIQRQGILYLYRTKVGIKFIDWTAKKFERLLKPMQYVVIASGYILMAGVIWLIGKISWLYLTSPTVAKALKVPVLMPLIPYLPELFHLDFLPPFYFTYWIIIIAIIAIPHEFAHGIFARLNKFKIHATGFGFLGPFLAAFVEPDEKQMSKAKKLPQMSVLAAGTFANVLVTIIFFLLMWAFVVAAFAPAGVYFAYPTGTLNVSEINNVGPFTLSQIQANPILLDNKTVVEVHTANMTYLTTADILETSIKDKLDTVGVSLDSPAFRAQMMGAISEIDGKKINSYDSLKSVLAEYRPGDNVTVTTAYQKNEQSAVEIKEYHIQLANNSGKAILGISILQVQKSSGVMGVIYGVVSAIKDPTLYYESRIGSFGIFIYDLLWWIALISFSVALMNMLPVGLFDGGRFFYLTVWGITKNEKVGKWAFKITTYLILALAAALMIKWVIAFS